MMKKWFSLMLFSLCLSPLLQAAPPKDWTTDLDAAKITAKKEKKAVYVLFTGSDWCPYCKKLHDDVLQKKEFQEFAKKNLILVYCDFPRANGPDKTQLEKQQRWNRELKAGRGVPCAVILSPDGKVLERIVGYLPLQAYLKKLEEVIR